MIYFVESIITKFNLLYNNLKNGIMPP